MVDEKELKARYKERIQQDLATGTTSSRDYKKFVEEFKEVPKTFYEKACNFAEKIGISPDKKTAAKIETAADFARLQVTPKGVYSFALLFPLLMILILTPLTFFAQGSFFLMVLVFIGALSSVFPLMKMPFYISDNFRLRASNQMVLSVFYIVTFMRHTSNLERAIEFAADHLAPPLSGEFRKVLWDVESGNFDTVEASIENFLEKWRDNNPEFVDAIHLIESSLLEGTEQRRIQSLEKAINLILDETYEKMLHFAHNLQSPITTLHMIGVILPILGLVILPLMTSFLGESVKWYHIAVLYNVFLPILVYLFGLKILSRRPSGYGDAPIAMDAKKSKNGKMKLLIGVFILFFVLLGLSPVILNATGFTDVGWGDISEQKGCGYQWCFLEQRDVDGVLEGPFSLVASLLSLFVILGIGLGIGLYYKWKTKGVIEVANKTKALENEFSSSLFQLGNRLGDNLPAETATLRVAESLPDTPSGNFFKIVSINIQKLGMSINDAIFDSKIGAIVYYPSGLIDSSMKVLIQSSKKGPLVASNALINISRYIKEMHKVEERLKDLMAEVISSMKSQINFLTPIISAIVVGITSMISSIIGVLGASVGDLTEAGTSGGGIDPTLLASFFKGGFPTLYFQLIVGLYVIQLIVILTILVNTIQNGSDKVQRDNMLGKNLIRSTITYVLLSGVVMFLFELIVVRIIPASF